MFINSVGRNWLTPPVVTVTGGVVQDYSTIGPKQGILSVLIMADVNIHVDQVAGNATTSSFLLLANTYMEIPVGDLIAFSFWGVSAGNLYVIEWLG